MVASEVSPWAKTGGLADVLGALSRALESLGHTLTIVMPRYRGMPPTGMVSATREVRLGAVGHLCRFDVETVSSRTRLVAVDIPKLFGRDGYYGQAGRDFPDNAERFAMLAAAALDFAENDAGPAIDVVHAHDWQTGLVPALVRLLPHRYPRCRGAGLVFTIHNLAYQGLFPRDVVPSLGLPWDIFRIETGEFWGKVSYLKCGISYGDYVTTVSPSYALETLTPEFGSGMEGALAGLGDRYVGILNGIDADEWDPRNDRHLPAHFSASDVRGKSECKRALLERMGLPRGDDALARPVVGMVSRLVAQKGLETIQQASEAMVALDATWVFLGTGDRRFQEFLRQLAARYPTRVAAEIGFNEGLAHLVEAGADMFLMPSVFEPCGLNQMYSLRYGTVPVVHAVGGLDDTVQPYTARALHANGFKFRPLAAEVLLRTLRQALRLFHDKAAWLRLMREGMTADYSWGPAAREYVKVYRRARQAAADRAAHSER